MRASDEKPPSDAVASGAPASTSRTQAEVLRGAVAGERWAHAVLYDTLYPIVARALQKILHQVPDYEDLVQTSFELIVRTLQKPRAQPIENLATWSSAIAARVALDALRVRTRERRYFDRDTEASDAVADVSAPPLERQLDVRSDLAWLQAALAAMNPDQAQAVLLHDVLGHDLFEVARLTEVSPAAAQKRLSRGHLELKRRAERLAKSRSK